MLRISAGAGVAWIDISREGVFIIPSIPLTISALTSPGGRPLYEDATCCIVFSIYVLSRV